MIDGFVDTRFERVRTAFAENFAQREEVGAACAVIPPGKPVVDVWGGRADRGAGAPGSRTRGGSSSPPPRA